MKTTVIVLAILGALASGFLGVNWLNSLSALSGMTDLERAMAQQMAAAQGQSLDSMGTAAIILVIGALVGIVGAVLVMKNKFSLAGGLLLGAGILPVLFQGKAVVFTALLIVAGALAFVLHSKQKAVPA
jgi:hypothetical protein